jgi:hypothetical protein
MSAVCTLTSCFQRKGCVHFLIFTVQSKPFPLRWKAGRSGSWNTDGSPHDVDRDCCSRQVLVAAVVCRVNMPVLPLRIANHHHPSRHGSSFCRDTTFSNNVCMTRRLSTHFGPSHLHLSCRGPTLTMYRVHASLTTEMSQEIQPAYLHAMQSPRPIKEYHYSGHQRIPAYPDSLSMRFLAHTHTTSSEYVAASG